MLLCSVAGSTAELAELPVLGQCLSVSEVNNVLSASISRITEK